MLYMALLSTKTVYIGRTHQMVQCITSIRMNTMPGTDNCYTTYTVETSRILRSLTEPTTKVSGYAS